MAVDLRKDSETFGKWYAVKLSAENKLMFYIPEGFAHGFLTLEDETEFTYKCTDLYAPEYDSGILWNDETINNILANINTLIDGKFEIDKRDLTLKLRGSSNQNIIDLN